MLRLGSADKNCQKIERLLSAYIDKETDASENKLVEKHLPICKKCRAKLETLEKTVKTVKSLEKVELPLKAQQSLLKTLREAQKSPPKETAKSWLQWFYRPAFVSAVAAVAVLLIAIIILPQLTNREAPRQKIFLTPKEELPKIQAPAGESLEQKATEGERAPVLKAASPLVVINAAKYTPENVGELLKLSIVKEFADYSSKEAESKRDTFFSQMIQQAKEYGEELKTALNMIKDRYKRFIPAYAERAFYNQNQSWIIIINWSPEENRLSKAKILIYDIKTKSLEEIE